MMIANALTLEELSRRTGEPIAELARWQSRNLIGTHGDQTFTSEDFRRVRLVRFLLRRGFTVDTIARADHDEDLMSRFLRVAFATAGTRTYSPAEAAAALGLDLDTLRRFQDACRLGEEMEWLEEDDVRALESMKSAVGRGFPEPALLQLVRVYADALARVAEAEVRLFHFYVHERTRISSPSERAVLDTVTTERLLPFSAPAILYFHRRGRESAVREDVAMHLRETAAPPNSMTVPGQLEVAVAFADLSNFTPLAEAMGDDAAAQVVERFAQLVRDAAGRCQGRIVKQIGDAFMLVFPDAALAVAWGLDIERQASGEPQFPAVRTGIHYGPVLYREGDYVGANVNVAARVAADAGRHQILVTAAVRNALGTVPDLEVVSVGRRHLKGIVEEVELFEVGERAAHAPVHRAVDPVCGMELDATQVAARLAFDGEERVFCSSQCLQRFVAAPESYQS